MLVRKNRKVAMASKRKWKKYWGKSMRKTSHITALKIFCGISYVATLKGSSLLFYQCDEGMMDNYDLPELKLGSCCSQYSFYSPLIDELTMHSFLFHRPGVEFGPHST